MSRPTGETGNPRDALTQYSDLLTDRLRILGPNHAHTQGTAMLLAKLAQSDAELEPVIAVCDLTRDDLAWGTLIGRVWELGHSGRAIAPSGDTPLRWLLRNLSKAAVGDDEARAALPPELLGLLEEDYSTRKPTSGR